jgi:hypothetical protein
MIMVLIRADRIVLVKWIVMVGDEWNLLEAISSGGLCY